MGCLWVKPDPTFYETGVTVDTVYSLFLISFYLFGLWTNFYVFAAIKTYKECTTNYECALDCVKAYHTKYSQLCLVQLKAPGGFVLQCYHYGVW